MTELERLEERLQTYYNAEASILSSQSYSINGKSLTRANLSEVRATIEKLEQKIKQIKNRQKGVSKMKRIVPLDF